MTRNLSELTSRTFDLVVVGGGIHGLAAAYDAAQRGLSVALLERGDFGSGSSFNHLKTVHGGLRSLQTGNLAKFRQGIRERRTIARIAPHLVRPLAFLLPTIPGNPTRNKVALGTALAIDAVVGADRNRDLEPHLALPRGRILTRPELLKICPQLAEMPVTGGALWYDYQTPQTERLTLAFAHAAVRHGAALANYVAADRLRTEGQRVVGVHARDVNTGERFDVAARTVLNAAGSGTDALVAELGLKPVGLYQKALNIVTRRAFGDVAIGAPLEGGTLFLVPWLGRLVIGTWHDDTAADPVRAEATSGDLERVIADANAGFPWLALRRDEVTLVHRGVVPAVRAANDRVAMRMHSAVVDHTRDGVEGIVSVVGVKYTTGRAVAEQAVDAIVRKLGRRADSCATNRVALPGAARDIAGVTKAVQALLPSGDPETAAHLAASYGTAAVRVLEPAKARPELFNRISSRHLAVAAEVVFSIRQEMAQTLIDVVARRMQIGTSGHPGEQAARAVAEVIAHDAGWSEARVERELEALRRFYLPIDTNPA